MEVQRVVVVELDLEPRRRRVTVFAVCGMPPCTWFGSLVDRKSPGWHAAHGVPATSASSRGDAGVVSAFSCNPRDKSPWQIAWKARRVPQPGRSGRSVREADEERPVLNKSLDDGAGCSQFSSLGS